MENDESEILPGIRLIRAFGDAVEAHARLLNEEAGWSFDTGNIDALRANGSSIVLEDD